MHRFAALFLSLLLAVTSVGFAMADIALPGQEIELCATDGAVTVILDAKGNPQPASAHHHCPDCLAAVAALALPTPLALPSAPDSLTRLALHRTIANFTNRTSPTPKARDPPAFA